MGNQSAIASGHLSRNMFNLRQARNLSQGALASLSGLPRSTVSHIESGSGNPSLRSLIKVANALHVSIEELLARIRLRLQDAPDRSIPPIRWANAEFDFDTLETSVDGNRVELTPYERGILTHLLRHPGRPVTRLQLIESALPGTDCSERTIDAHVARLRRKLGPAASGAIKTMRGVGYRFDR